MGAIGVQFTETLHLVTTSCAACGIVFGLPSDFDKRLRDGHAPFYCPNGHRLGYRGTTEAESLREELERTRKDLSSRLEAAWAEANKANAEAWALKRRARGGLCPCCKRSFVGLARHMKTKHPAFAAGKER